MKLIWISGASVLVVLGLSGCARLKVTHRKGDQFTICANRYAKDEDFVKLVVKTCAGRATQVGGSSFEVANSHHRNASTHPVAGMTPERTCRTYLCIGTLTP